MPFDKTAHAAQLASCVSHTGDTLSFNGAEFSANLGSIAPRGLPAVADIDPRAALYISAPRGCDAFASKAPSTGDYFKTDKLQYRVLRDFSVGPLAVFACAPGIPLAP